MPYDGFSPASPGSSEHPLHAVDCCSVSCPALQIYLFFHILHRYLLCAFYVPHIIPRDTGWTELVGPGPGININSSPDQQVHADGDGGEGEIVLDPTGELRFTWKPRMAGGN